MHFSFTTFSNINFRVPVWTLSGLAALLLSIGCSRRPALSSGEIQILSGVYPGASRGLEQGRTFLLSTLYFKGPHVVEKALSPNGSYRLYRILPQGQIELGSGPKSGEGTAPQSFGQKTSGAPFFPGLPLNYHQRRDLSDTLLFKKRYRRFEISTPYRYERYYIYPTDSLSPYEPYGEIYPDYKGRIERLDRYEKKSDLFTTFQVLYKEGISREGKSVLQAIVDFEKN